MKLKLQKIIYSVIFPLFFLASCGVKQLPTTSFVQMDNPSDLNGKYINSNGTEYLSSVLFDRHNYNDNQNRSVDIVNLDFPTKDSLIISFTDAEGYKTFKFKGQTKDNYFEYYVQKNRLYLPPFFLRHWVSKRRIGKNENGKLDVHEYYNNFGALFIIGGGESDTDSITFEPYDKNYQRQLVSVNINGKWGYKDKNDSLVIAPQYDYAQLFENGIAKVLLDEKWGYIDILNQIVIPISYDVILPPQDSTLRVCKDLKWGLIDFSDNIIAPIKYNQIGKFGGEMYNDSLFKNLAIVHKDNKIGFINKRGEVVVPVIYDEINNFSGDFYHQTKLGDKYGFITSCGVFCDPIFDKVGYFRDEKFAPANKAVIDKIGKYAKVKFNRKPYVLGENGLIYPYSTEALSFLNPDVAILKIDFEHGIKVAK